MEQPHMPQPFSYIRLYFIISKKELDQKFEYNTPLATSSFPLTK